MVFQIFEYTDIRYLLTTTVRTLLVITGNTVYSVTTVIITAMYTNSTTSPNTVKLLYYEDSQGTKKNSYYTEIH